MTDYSSSLTLVLSVGNTNVHVALADGIDIVRHTALPLDPWPPSREDFLGWFDFESVPIDSAAIAGVRPDLVGAIKDVLASAGIPTEEVGVDFPVTIENLYEHPEGVGVDRLLGVLAASHLFPGKGVVVIDFGTALTFNVGSPEGAFLGGLICIGASSAASSMPGRTPMLPLVELSPAEGFVAKNTHRAINDGIVWEIVGGVERVLDGLRHELAFDFCCVATGGDARVIVPHVRGVDRIEEQLVLRGLCIAYKARRNSMQ